MIHLHFHSEYNQICMSYKSPGIYPKYLASKAENPNGQFLFSLKKKKKKKRDIFTPVLLSIHFYILTILCCPFDRHHSALACSRCPRLQPTVPDLPLAHSPQLIQSFLLCWQTTSRLRHSRR